MSSLSFCDYCHTIARNDVKILVCITHISHYFKIFTITITFVRSQHEYGEYSIKNILYLEYITILLYFPG